MRHMELDIKKLISDVEQWFDDKGITSGPLKATPLSQHSKMQEEVVEFRDELVMLGVHEATGAAEAAHGVRERAINELGDVFVTAIGSAKLLGVTPYDAILSAYEKISKRDGSMQNGTFVKNS